MVRISEFNNFFYFPETFPGNFRTICPISKVPEFLVEWKASNISVMTSSERIYCRFGQNKTTTTTTTRVTISRRVPKSGYTLNEP